MDQVAEKSLSRAARRQLERGGKIVMLHNKTSKKLIAISKAAEEQMWNGFWEEQRKGARTAND